MRPTLAALAAAAILAAAGCAETPKVVGNELVAVIPGPAGEVGAVVVTSGGSRQVLDQPYAARRVKADGSAEPAVLSAGEVKQAFAATMDALPGRPATFLLYFHEGKDELTATSRAELDSILAELRRRPAPDIVVIGHTDTMGTPAYNDKLSLARAERVREILVGVGIARERMQTAGRGERELLVATGDEAPEPRNRRVEISVR